MSGAALSRGSALPAGAAERQGLRAGVISRIGALMIDLLYVAALLGAAYLALAGFRFLRSARTFAWPQPSFQETFVAGVIVAVLMLATGWASTGRTRGMQVMGLRLVGRSGTRVGPGLAFARAVACIAFPLGLAWSAFSNRNASVQDLVFGTSVVYDWHMHVPPARTDEASAPATANS